MYIPKIVLTVAKNNKCPRLAQYTYKMAEDATAKCPV